jgi:hypothetical protein
MTPPALDANHRRSISVSLRLVDKALCDWERLARGQVSSGVLYQERDTLSPGQKKEFQLRIANVRHLIAHLRRDLILESETTATSQVIIGQANVLWEMLTELNSRSLSGYGTVSPELANYIDPIGKELAAQMYQISSLFARET